MDISECNMIKNVEDANCNEWYNTQPQFCFDLCNAVDVTQSVDHILVIVNKHKNYIHYFVPRLSLEVHMLPQPHTVMMLAKCLTKWGLLVFLIK